MMKRIVLLSIAICLYVSMQAQHTKGDFSFVPKVGLDLSKFTNDEIHVDIDGKTVKSSYKEGLTAGFDAEYFLHEHASLSAGIYYMNMGSRYKDFMGEDDQSGTGWSHFRTTMEFMQIPLMGSLHLDNGLSVKLGVQLGHMIHSKISYEMQSWTRDEDGAREYSDPIKSDGDIVDEWKKKFYFGIPVALAYEYQNVILEARYLRSLTHPMKSDVYKESHHSTFLFTVGYRIK